MIRFECPNCGSLLESPDHKAGKKVECPKPGCKQRLQIPARAVPTARNKTVLGSLVAFLIPRPKPSAQAAAKQPPRVPVEPAPSSQPVAPSTTLPQALPVKAPAPAGTAGPWFYYIKNGQRFGPVPLKEMQERVASHQLRPEDLVWREGTPQWVPAREVAELFQNTPEVVSLPAPVEVLPMVLPVEDLRPSLAKSSTAGRKDIPSKTSSHAQAATETPVNEVSAPLGRPVAVGADDEAIRCPYCGSTQFFGGRRVTTTGWILYGCAIANFLVSLLLMWVCIGFVTIFLTPVLALIGVVYCRSLVNTCGRCRKDF